MCQMPVSACLALAQTILTPYASQHFCYRCGAKLDPSNPYKHFSTVGYACYSKLFDVQSQEDDEGHWPLEVFEP